MFNISAHSHYRDIKRGISLFIIYTVALFPLFTPVDGIAELSSQSYGDSAVSGQQNQFVTSPKLEVQKFSGEFEEWGNSLVIYSADTLKFRFGKPIMASLNEWRLLDGLSDSATVLASGYVSATPSIDGISQFKINLKGKLPYSPPGSPKDYFVRLIPHGSGTNIPSLPVTLTYRINDYETHFTELGLNPDMLYPRRVFINLEHLTIHKADEENDEEPYLIAVAVYLDGTNIDILDLPHATVRVASNHGTHGNVPQYNGELGSGDTVFIPKETGYFETRIEPIRPDLADTNLLGVEIEAADLARATNVALFVLALEEDGTSTEAADATRDAFVTGLESRLNAILQSITLDQLVNILRAANPQTELLEMIPWIELSNELREEAVKAGESEELDDFVNWSDFIVGAPGAGLISLLSAADIDDVVGAGIAVVNLYELYFSDRPQSINMDFVLRKSAEYPSASAQIAHYTLSGQIGRCATLNPVPIEESGRRCERYYNPYIFTQYYYR